MSAKPHPRNAQTVLEAIRAGATTRAAVIQATGLTPRQATAALRPLIKRALAQVPSPGVYAMTPAGIEWLQSGHSIASGQGAKRPRPTRGLRQRAWWVMVKEKTFTLDGLLYTVATGEELNAQDNLRRYLKALAATGFIVRCKHSEGWKLVADRAGRTAPIVRARHGQVVCGNTGTVYPIGADHE